MNKVKQTIVIRKDLNMRKGKMIAQGAHASMMFLIPILKDLLKDAMDQLLISADLYDSMDADQQEWLFNGKFTKVVLSVDSEEELLSIFDQAKNAGLTVHKVIDEGLTEFNNTPTLTAIAIGPHQSSLIDPITKDLKCL